MLQRLRRLQKIGAKTGDMTEKRPFAHLSAPTDDVSKTDTIFISPAKVKTDAQENGLMSPSRILSPVRPESEQTTPIKSDTSIVSKELT